MRTNRDSRIALPSSKDHTCCSLTKCLSWEMAMNSGLYVCSCWKKKTPFTLQEILISRNNISFSWRTRCDRQANGDGGQVPVTVPVTCPLLRHGHLAQPWVHRNNMEMWRRGRKSAMFDPSADHRSCSSLRTSKGPLSYPQRPWVCTSACLHVQGSLLFTAVYVTLAGRWVLRDSPFSHLAERVDYWPQSSPLQASGDQNSSSHHAKQMRHLSTPPSLNFINMKIYNVKINQSI